MSEVEAASRELSAEKEALKKEETQVAEDVKAWDRRAGELEQEAGEACGRLGRPPLKPSTTPNGSSSTT